ncbi:phosphotransferase enzyme family protein [Lederbergia wuyishanensis]|uniref:Ser/Thr protein kinase RdoA (MazF antagonist) n=1 Tax=Lederbergia wuyishanensis TaxID=1347903 RepID=A0ABU0D2T5_9BACI|nr:phosphotransferase [Lederbergia wuyishanensis]MCJ8007165.1 phosphotransferase [Lederbergia wuyishanensis]MDQ0342690.1 Ser/Thr protein kinase RdoA (MazF antagonist) [Lederbergia wuyishanensis]
MNYKILESLNKLYPVDLIKVEPVTNEVYRCIAEQGIFFARITNYKTYDEQLEEVTYTNFLYNEGFGVSPTIFSKNGNLVEKIMLDKEFLTVLYKGASGIHLPKNQWNASVFNELGRQIGRLHRLSKKFEEIETIKYINDWYDNEEYAFLKYIPKEESSIREIANEVLSTIKKLPKCHSTYGLLHGDLWLENILVDSDSKFTMIDFQDCEKHFYIFDLAVPIYSALEYSFVGNGNIVDYGRSITKAIIDGYQEENELSPDMLDKLPLFIKLKEIFEYNLMHMYWNKEKLTEEQIRIMNHFRIRIEHNHSILKIQ